MKNIAIAAVLIVALCVVSWGAWDDVPDNMKTEITTYSYDKSPELTIRIWYNTLDTLRLATTDPWEEVADDMQKFLDTVHKIWPGQATVIVGVIPHGTQYFFPSDLAFTQGVNQYDVHVDDYAKMTDSFDAGRLREGVVALGVVAVPKGIDLTQPYRIWYDEDYSVMPPLQTESHRAGT
jgi:hypothetical protein